jgi:hypothetical protein
LPRIAKVIRVLRKEKYNLPENVLTIEELKESLSQY